MKTYILLLLALIITSAAKAQPDSYNDHPRHNNHKFSSQKVQKLDSVIVYVWDTQSAIDLPDNVFVYEYCCKKDDPFEVVKYNLPERTNSNRQQYTYTRDGFKTSYLYQEWAGNAWQDMMLTKYSQNEEGKLGHELFSKPGISGQWVEYQQHFYEYDQEGRIALYRRQMSNGDGSWYDFSENIWTFNDNDQLLMRIEKRTADDYIIWTETYNYGDGIKPVERIRQTMRYDPVVRHNVLTNDTRNLYYYDSFMDPSVVELYRWKNNEWVYAGKNMYFYSFIPGRKVTVCHNGHTISIAPQALPAHLAHGDQLGACTEDNESGKPSVPSYQQENKPSVIVFPNPANNYFEVKLQPGHKFHEATLFSGDGRIITSKNIAEMEHIYFDIANLLKGNYILKISGPGCADEVLVVMK